MNSDKYLHTINSTIDALNLAYAEINKFETLKHEFFDLTKGTSESRQLALKKLKRASGACERLRIAFMKDMLQEAEAEDRKSRAEQYIANQARIIKNVSDITDAEKVSELKQISEELNSLSQKIGDMRKNFSKKIDPLEQEIRDLQAKAGILKDEILREVLEQHGQEVYCVDAETRNVIPLKILPKTMFHGPRPLPDPLIDFLYIAVSHVGLTRDGQIKNYHEDLTYDSEEKAKEYAKRQEYLKEKQQEIDNGLTTIDEEFSRRLHHPEEIYRKSQTTDDIYD